MASCKYTWPDAGDRQWIGKAVSRLDGPAKSSGRAKYTYDINQPGMLFGRILQSPYAHCTVKSVDTSAAEKMPEVKAIRIIQGPGAEIHWAGDEVVAVAATSEEAAEDALRRIKVEYEVLPHFVMDEDLEAARQAGHVKPGSNDTVGDPKTAFADPEAVVTEGFYGAPVITHNCMETHGDVVEWTDAQHMRVWASTQGVSVVPGQFAEVMNLPATNVEVICQHIGGGFGSKFSADRWGIETARLSKLAGGKPVKTMLTRDEDQKVAGARPSIWAKVRMAAKKDGTITAWESESWATGGMTGGGSPPLPYILNIPHQSKQHTEVQSNIGGARAWRAPLHPQAALVTMSALEDLAARLEIDPIELIRKNSNLLGPRAHVYLEELDKAQELSEWKTLWHPRGDKAKGPVKRGLGVSFHTWGGRGHASMCDCTIQPDGSVSLKLGSQDLGVGTRTIIAIVAADTFGLPIEAVQVNIGDSHYPYSGASGGSTTSGGVSSSTRRAAVDARDELFAVVAPALGVPADQLEARSGLIQVKGNPSKRLSWKQACSKLGVKTIQTRGKNPGPCPLISSGVGGVQIADVSVDTETGIVSINRLVAVQDCGLVLDMKTCMSQVYGALIMGASYSLFEEKVMDPATGIMLNANMEFYKLAGIRDIGKQLVVHMMTGPGYDERGVIGVSEPPAVSPGAAISNAVANAIGVRVPSLPLSPDRVLAALEKGAKV